MLDLDDTIAAIATARGAAGLAVVRVSGARALAIADAVFEGERLSGVPGHTLHHGWAAWPPGPAADGRSGGEDVRVPAEAAGTAARARLDEVVAAVFRAPRSYTREDVVEFSCHGGALPAERVLSALLAAGARLARPGEFTLRAFLSGRLDLAQAEAVADLVHAETGGAHALALSQLAGALSRRLGAVAETLRDCLAEVEARVDFAEDVGGVELPERVVEAIAAAESQLAAMLEGSAYARAVREGVRVAIVGRPNVGKSSLFNALLGERRAIVTAVPGTTRDLVSEAVEVSGVRVTLTDTAGLRAAADEVESEGVARAGAALAESAIVLWVVDAASRLETGDREIAGRLAGRRVLVALNKRDLPKAIEAADVAALLGPGRFVTINVSATRGDGVAELKAALGECMGGREGPGGAVANRRHIAALERAREALSRASGAAAATAPGEIVALELRESLAAIGEVTGESVDPDLLERIFARFCIGK